jgi:hypothetical protein
MTKMPVLCSFAKVSRIDIRSRVCGRFKQNKNQKGGVVWIGEKNTRRR